MQSQTIAIFRSPKGNVSKRIVAQVPFLDFDALRKAADFRGIPSDWYRVASWDAAEVVNPQTE